MRRRVLFSRRCEELARSDTHKAVLFQFVPGTLHVDVLHSGKLFAHPKTGGGARLSVFPQPHNITSFQVSTNRAFHDDRLSRILPDRPESGCGRGSKTAYHPNRSALQAGVRVFDEEVLSKSQSARPGSLGHEVRRIGFVGSCCKPERCSALLAAYKSRVLCLVFLEDAHRSSSRRSVTRLNGARLRQSLECKRREGNTAYSLSIHPFAPSCF